MLTPSQLARFRTRLTLAILLSSLIMLLLAGLGLVIYERFRVEQVMVRDLDSAARWIAERSATALLFNDPEVARASLAAVAAKPAVTTALIRTPDGSDFARYDAPDQSVHPLPARLPSRRPDFAGGELLIGAPIALDGERLGQVVIRASLGDFNRLWRRFLLIAAGILVIATLVALPLALLWQRWLLRPLDALLARRIQADQDASGREPLETRDEFGRLGSHFNTLLDRTEANERDLAAAKRDLALHSEQLEQRQHPFDLEDLLRSLRESLATRADDKDLALLFHIDPDVPQGLLGDANRLGHVLTHLLDNAIKFTETGTIRLRVGRDPLVQADAQRIPLRFAIEDTGCGISAARQQQLLQSFSRADGAGTRKQGSGLGLDPGLGPDPNPDPSPGLAKSARLVSLMGGEIRLESQPGAGSTFWVSLSFAPPPRQDASPWSLPPRVRQQRALIIAATPELVFALGRMLDAMQVLAGSASSGREALAILATAAARGRAFDFVLCSWPGGEGRPGDPAGAELCQQLRDRPDAKRPAIFMLARPRERERLRADQTLLGLSAVLDLPLLPTELARALVDARRQPRSAAERRAKDTAPSQSRQSAAPALPSSPQSPDALRQVLEALVPDIRARRATRCHASLKTLESLDWPEPLRADMQELMRLLGKYRFGEAGDILKRLLQALKS
ncbi:Signal transduction histidine-protein kinase BarA [Thiorhodovibrio winogradskyi]|uniref:histidine kinase n=1 Tax=Thiorhodovibrio winogradskyi TaxID=77007 RepID=A0ABZ0S5G3_9GAMM|nr:ATP-binding protein [Thiorhodovibrio winogradskyi]